MLRFTLIALLTAGLFSSCANCWSGGIPLRPSEENALRGAVNDYGDTSNAVVYRGLAHPQVETSLYEKQVEAGGWVEFEDFKFFKEPVDVPRETIDRVLSLYAESNSHQAWGEKDLCPGFHPDYAIVWSDGGTQRVIQFCYGCHEWKFFGPGGMLYTDISEDAYFGPLTRKWLKKEGR